MCTSTVLFSPITGPAPALRISSSIFVGVGFLGIVIPGVPFGASATAGNPSRVIWGAPVALPGNTRLMSMTCTNPSPDPRPNCCGSVSRVFCESIKPRAVTLAMDAEWGIATASRDPRDPHRRPALTTSAALADTGTYFAGLLESYPTETSFSPVAPRQSDTATSTTSPGCTRGPVPATISRHCARDGSSGVGELTVDSVVVSVDTVSACTEGPEPNAILPVAVDPAKAAATQPSPAITASRERTDPRFISRYSHGCTHAARVSVGCACLKKRTPPPPPWHRVSAVAAQSAYRFLSSRMPRAGPESVPPSVAAAEALAPARRARRRIFLSLTTLSPSAPGVHISTSSSL